MKLNVINQTVNKLNSREINLSREGLHYNQRCAHQLRLQLEQGEARTLVHEAQAREQGQQLCVHTLCHGSSALAQPATAQGVRSGGQGSQALQQQLQGLLVHSLGGLTPQRQQQAVRRHVHAGLRHRRAAVPLRAAAAA